MAFYVANGNVYLQDGNGEVHPVSLTAKNKVITTSELEHIKTHVSDRKVDLPANAVGATMDDIIRKFNLSEDRPVKFDENRHKAALGEESDDDLFDDVPEKPAPKRRGRRVKE